MFMINDLIVMSHNIFELDPFPLTLSEVLIELLVQRFEEVLLGSVLPPCAV